jgi:hypothetical protein
MEEFGYSDVLSPEYHKILDSMDNVAETFAYFYEMGAATELFVHDEETWEDLVIASRRIATKT